MDLTKFFPNERVDLKDMSDAGGQLNIDDRMREGRIFLLPEGRTGTTGQDARVISGFDVVGNPVGTTSITINRGIGICKFYDNGVLKHGIIMGDDGPENYVLDLSAASNDTYYVWARFVQSDGEYENRVFWNPTGSPAQEYVENVATRSQSTWELIYQSSSSSSPPGHGEYFRIYTVVKSGGVITTVTDTRHFLFEGDTASSPAYDHEWGDGANDRNADRAQYGVKDLHKFIAFVKRQLSDIIERNASSPVHYVLPDRGLKETYDLFAIEHKSSGEHSDVDCDTLDCAGAANIEGATEARGGILALGKSGEDWVRAARVNNLDEGKLLDWITRKTLTEKNFYSIDRSGHRGLTLRFQERFLYRNLSLTDIQNGIVPHWGHYYKTGTTPTIGGVKLWQTYKNFRSGGRLVVVPDDSAVSNWSGIRTAGKDNDFTMGWFYLDNQPSGGFSVSKGTVYDENYLIKCGFTIAYNPLDGNPSRAYIEIDAASDTCKGKITGNTGIGTTGTTNLFGTDTYLGLLSSDGQIQCKIEIYSTTQVRFTCLNTGISEYLTATEAMNNNFLYDWFMIVTHTGTVGQGPQIHFDYFQLWDSAYNGPDTLIS